MNSEINISSEKKKNHTKFCKIFDTYKKKKKREKK